MARIVKALPWDQRGPRPKYPWDEWLDGQVRLLIEGEDFTCDPKSLQVYTYQKARSLGLHANVLLRREGLYIQAYS